MMWVCNVMSFEYPKQVNPTNTGWQHPGMGWSGVSCLLVGCISTAKIEHSRTRLCGCQHNMNMFHAAELLFQMTNFVYCVVGVLLKFLKKWRVSRWFKVLRAFTVQAWGPKSKSQHPRQVWPCLCLKPPCCGMEQRQEHWWGFLVTSLVQVQWETLSQESKVESDRAGHDVSLLCSSSMHSCIQTHSCTHHPHTCCTHTHTRSKPTRLQSVLYSL